MEQEAKRVVIVGAGFAGLWAAKKLAGKKGVHVTLIDRNNYHSFLPLLYQVAAAELEPEQIGYPLRGVFRKVSNVSTVMAEVERVDFASRTVHTEGPSFSYDYLMLAPGSTTTFFGIPGAEENSFTLKTLEEAVTLRNHLLACFERAALGWDADRVPGLLNIVVVGAGPTGLEYAGALAELIRSPLAKDFPAIKGKARVMLLDATDNVLPGFPQHLREYAHGRLTRMGVDVRAGSAVKEVEKDLVHLADGSSIHACTIVWSAGVRGHKMGEELGIPLGKASRVVVQPTLQTREHPEVFVAGDIALPDGQNPPMLAPNATQQGRHVADTILRLVKGEAAQPFRYRDKGAMVTIGRNAAIAQIGKLNFTGFTAWILWLFVHLAYLIGFRNRLFVLTNWAWDYFFGERAVRLILPRTASIIETCGKDSAEMCTLQDKDADSNTPR